MDLEAARKQKLIKALTFYLRALQHYNSKNKEYSIKLYYSLNKYIGFFSKYMLDFRKEILSCYFLLIDRLFPLHEYAFAADCYDRIVHYEGSLDVMHLLQSLNAHIALHNWSKAEKLLKVIQKRSLSSQQNERYCESCIHLGDYYATFSTACKNKQQLALEHYFEAYKTASKPELKIAIIEKISKLPRAIIYSDECIKTLSIEAVKIDESRQLEAAYTYLLIFQLCSEKESITSCKSIDALEHLLSAINVLFQSNFGELAVELIHRTDLAIGSIKEHLSVKTSGLFVKKPISIQSSLKGLVNTENAFTASIFSKIYFLYAKIISHIFPREQARILSLYEQAVQLAPGNKFGADALFMEDHQKSPNDNLSELIEIYRRLAIDWGAEV